MTTHNDTSSFKDFFKGISDSLKAFSFIFNNRLGHYFIYPLFITVLLIIGSQQLIKQIIVITQSFIYETSGITPLTTADWPDTFSTWVHYLSEKTIGILLWLLAIYIVHKVLKYIVLIIMSPVMAMLSERTEKILTGNSYEFNLKQLLIDVWRGIIIATRNMIIELGLVILIWIVNILLTTAFPPITIVTSPLSLILGIVISSYFYGFATIDYVNERRKLSIKESYQFVRKYKWLAIGNGLVFWGFISIPFLGTYIGTIFAPILCSAGIVISLHDKLHLSSSTAKDINILITQKELDKTN